MADEEKVVRCGGPLYSEELAIRIKVENISRAWIIFPDMDCPGT